MNIYHNNWPSKNGLRIGHLNANSVYNKLSDITQFLDNNGKGFHILGITESRLNSQINDTEINIPGYKLIRKDPTKPKDTGILIYITDSIPFRRLSKLEQSPVESVWIEVQIKKSSPVVVGICYRNPSEHVNWIDKFYTTAETVLTEYNEIILLGDFNIDLLKPQIQWQKTLDSLNLYQLIKSPTRVTANSKTLIDHIYVSEPKHVLESCCPVSACSDHFPVCLTWSRKRMKVPKIGHKTVPYRCFSKFDENEFLTDLCNSELPQVYNITDPDQAVQFWIKTFSNIYDKHAPFKTKRTKRAPKPRWLTKEIQEAIHLRDYLKKHGYHEESKKIRNAINSQKRKEKQKYFQHLLSLKHDTKSIWKAINQLTNKNSAVVTTNTNDVTAEDLNTYFSSVGSKVISTNHSKSNDLQILKTYLRSKNVRSNLSIPPMTVSDVYNALRHLKENGARDLDGLDGKVLKLSAPIITDTLTYIYNLCIDKNHIPKTFKTAKVIPIYKNGCRSDPSNYRPISVLSLLSKPLEKHINTWILKHLNQNKLLHPNQSGFRENHSCHTALIKLADNWLHNINKNEYCGALFVDFKKAFDIIDHDLLLRKLELYGLSDNTVNLLKSYLTNRQQCVRVNSSISSLKTLTNGVPQGSVLGPLLFSIYINDLPLSIKNECELFADDTTIHSGSPDLGTLQASLQDSINDLANWSEMNHMVLHPQKTKYMLITTRQKRQNLETKLRPLTINNQIIDEVDNHKVLGVTIDNNLSWTNHLTSLCKRICVKTHQLSKIKHFLNLHSRNLFFKTQIQSLIDYSSTLWDTASANTLKPLIRLHKRAIKLVLQKTTSLTDDDYKSLNVLPIYKRLNFNKGILMHKIITGKAPPYLTNSFSINQSRCKLNIHVPNPRIDLYKSSLTYSGAKLWNSLPTPVKESKSTNIFKQRYSSYLAR